MQRLILIVDVPEENFKGGRICPPLDIHEKSFDQIGLNTVQNVTAQENLRHCLYKKY